MGVPFSAWIAATLDSDSCQRCTPLASCTAGMPSVRTPCTCRRRAERLITEANRRSTGMSNAVDSEPSCDGPCTGFWPRMV